MRRILTSLLFVASLAGSASAADVHGVPYARWGSYLPACDSPGVMARISEKFAYQDARVVHSGVSIARIDNVREDARGTPWQGFIDRRFCGATAWLSNGKRASVAYLIEGPHLGTFSFGYHVESCVVGVDPWRVYDAACRAIRP